jgi:hypothetical protein
LLAVLAGGLDRDSLWEAFRARRTYASTGARALVDFSINDSPMGSEIEATGDVEIRIEIEGTAPIERVDLIRGASRLHRWEPAGSTSAFAETLRDSPPSGETYYYARIEQADGEFIWASPVWVRSRRGASPAELPAWNEPEAIDPAAVDGGEAGEHLEALLDYLRIEEDADAFSDVTPVKTTRSPMGEYAVFFARLRGHRIRIHWFYEFDLPRLRIEAGWVHYGREKIMGTEWARPLFENMDVL